MSLDSNCAVIIFIFDSVKKGHNKTARVTKIMIVAYLWATVLLKETNFPAVRDWSPLLWREM